MASNHNSRKALGLGSGIYSVAANGLDIDFELERIVDEQGVQIQTTSHDGAISFNAREQQLMQMDTTCAACHASA